MILGALILALLMLIGCAPDDKTISVVFGGDILLARGGKPIFKDWQNIDLSFPGQAKPKHPYFYVANLESPLTDKIPANIPESLGDMNLCATEDQIPILKNAGFTLLTIANNHQNDCEDNGIQLTEQILKKNLISSTGMPYRVTHLETPGSSLAFISADDIASPVESGQLAEMIASEKKNGNFVVVSIHWGHEYQAGPTERQESLAIQWVDAGADVIWGHHPHVLQKMDSFTSSVDGHTGLVFYSMGNLLSDQFMLPDTQRSALIKIDIRENKIVGIQVIPVTFDVLRKTLKFNNPDGLNQFVLDRLEVDTLKQKGVPLEMQADD
jgi:poly-gamma-glutamate synthesis protein (capsule biosynthesis protein)